MTEVWELDQEVAVRFPQQKKEFRVGRVVKLTETQIHVSIHNHSVYQGVRKYNRSGQREVGVKKFASELIPLTEDLKKKIEDQDLSLKAIRVIRKTDFDGLSLERLKAIVQIIES